MGCLTTTTLRPLDFRILATLLEVGLFPAPVLTAPTEITGFEDLSMVLFGPRSMKSAPAARAMEALCITYSWETSL